MRFEWDANKALLNVVKHKISFREATEVFNDPDAVEVYDTFHSTKRDTIFPNRVLKSAPVVCRLYGAVNEYNSTYFSAEGQSSRT
jgi:uncharacterized DUF497 family protein